MIDYNFVEMNEIHYNSNDLILIMNNYAMQIINYN